MAESSWPSPSNGRVVNDAQYERLGMSYGPVAGMVGRFETPAVVFADSTGMQIKVSADRYALVRGHEWYSGSTIFTKAIEANSSGSTRTDLVVLRLSRTTWNVTIEVLPGTPGVPTPTQDLGSTGVYDLPLATVTVANGAATISAANVTYLAAHLCQDGSGYLVPSYAALAYIPESALGQRAYVTDGRSYTHNGVGWGPTPGISYTVLINDDQTNVTTERAVWTVVLPAEFITPSGIYKVRVRNFKGSGDTVGASYGVRIRENSAAGTLLGMAENTVTTPAGRQMRWNVDGRWTAPATVPTGLKTFVVTYKLEAGTGSGDTHNSPIEGSFFEATHLGRNTSWHTTV